MYQVPINDIRQCVHQARQFQHGVYRTRPVDHSLYKAFVSLAGDETTGFLAYVIWRGRASLLSSKYGV